MSTAVLPFESRSLAENWFRAAALLDLRRYVFRDEWRVVGTVKEVTEMFVRSTTPAEWWPQLRGLGIYETGAADGAQRSFRSRLRGFLPYELDVDFRIVEVEFPGRFAVEFRGDLQGRGDGYLCQEGNETVIRFDTTMRVRRPLLQLLSFLVRPILRAQHRWVMRGGEQGLDRALGQRRGN